MADARTRFFDGLYREYFGALSRFLFSRLGSRQEAEELAQESYLRMYRAEGVRTPEHARAFLFRTASNLATDLYRQRRSRPAPGGLREADGVISELPSPEQVACARERLEALRQAIIELPPKCRRVFILHKINHLSHRQIAVKLGITKHAVEKHVMRGMARCYQRLHAE